MSRTEYESRLPTASDEPQTAGSPWVSRFRGFHFSKQVSVAVGLIRGGVWRLRGRSDGWPVVHPTVRVACRNGRIRVGHFTNLGRRVLLQVTGAPGGPPARLEIGAASRIWEYTRVIVHTSVSIGDNCAISWNCNILDGDLHRMTYDGDVWENDRAPIVIEDHVWIGCNVTVLKGVTIGSGAVIAAGSVVARDIPPRTLAAGVPAKPIKHVESWT